MAGATPGLTPGGVFPGGGTGGGLRGGQAQGPHISRAPLLVPTKWGSLALSIEARVNVFGGSAASGSV